MKDMSIFKIVVLAVFALAFVTGVILFAISKGFSSPAVNLVVWGTIPSEAFDLAYRNSSIYNSEIIKINYLKKNTSNFDADFVESLADGIGPDIVILREDSIYKNRNKIFVIPYKNYSERVFKDSFIEEGELFLSPEGVMGVPFIIDPMVMYWNRDIFSNNLVSQPPKYWDEMNTLVNKITKKDSAGNVLQSTVALGEWRNITNSKEIISLLLLQAGTPIVSRDSNGALISVLNGSFDRPIKPSQSAISFFTQFSNPTAPTYTWNRSLPSSLNFFLSGNLATYLGFASEIFSIQQKNSNLNFDVTYIPQIRDTTKKTNFAHIYALAIVRQSREAPSAYTAIRALTEAGAIKALEAATNLPPVRRDLLADQPSDAFRAVFYNSALISSSWIDPNPVATASIFRDMIEGVTGGRVRISDGLNKSNQDLSAELK